MPPFAKSSRVILSLILLVVFCSGMSSAPPEPTIPKQLQLDVAVKVVPTAKRIESPTEAELPALKARADAGDPAALAVYGWRLQQEAQRGQTRIVHPEEAEALLRQAAETGDATGQYLYGLSLEDTDLEQSNAWIQKAADQGLPQAALALARGPYSEMRYPDEILRERLQWLRKAASLGIPRAAHDLGMSYYEVGHDAVAAYTWLYLARHGFSSPAVQPEDQGYDESSYDNPLKFLAWTMTLEEMRQVEAALKAWPTLPPEVPLIKPTRRFQDGRNGPTPPPPPLLFPKELVDIETKAAAGDTAAKLALGELYLTGRGVPLDRAKGIALITEAAATGDAASILFQAALYRDGFAVPRSLEKARDLYRPLAEKGNAEAQVGLAMMLQYLRYEGDSSEESRAASDKEALGWLEKAAAQDNFTAIFQLAKRYEDDKDYAKAAQSLETAAAKSSGATMEAALNARIGLAEHMRSATDLYMWLSIYMSCETPAKRGELRGLMFNFAGGLTDEQVIQQKVRADAWLREHPEAVQRALEYNAKADALQDEDSTFPPLHKAVIEGNIKEIQRLLAAGVSPNLQDANGRTPLHMVARAPDMAGAQLLLASGAFIDAQAMFGETPLMDAVSADNQAAVAFLLASGANTALGDTNGATPLHKAAAEGNVGIAKALITAKADINAAGPNNSTPLSMAIGYGELEMSLMLLTAGANPNIANDQGRTPLQEAVRARLLDIVKALLAAGADPNVADAKGTTPLQVAVRGKQQEIVTALLAGKANVDAQDTAGVSLLHEAVQQDDAAVLGLLLAAGADPNLQNEAGETPLFRAVKDNQTDMVKALLDAEANPNLLTKRGTTALHLAAGRTDTTSLRLILATKVMPDTLDDPNEDGRTPLLLAADRGTPESVALLLDEGADPNIADQYGYTPLIEASMRGEDSAIVVKALLAAKAAPNTQGGSMKNTALHIAAELHNLEQVRLLLAAKADPNILNAEGRTVLDIARDQEIIKALEKAGATHAKPKSQVAMYDELGRPMNAAAEEAQRDDAKGVSLKKNVHVSFYGQNQAEAFQEAVDQERAGVKSPYLTRAVLMDMSLEELDARIKAGTKVNEEDPVFGLPLNQAIEQHRSPEMIDFLLKNGADPKLGNPLDQAVSTGYAEAITLLLAAGADPNSTDDEGEPILIRVVIGESLNATKALLEAGATVDAKDEDGYTALYYALKDEDRYPLVPLLLEKGASATAFPALLALRWNEEAVPMGILLLEHGASVKVANSRQESVVHWAVDEKSPELLAAAVKAGAALDLRDEEGDTALYLAVRRGKADMVRALLKAGAPIKGSAIRPGAKFVDTGGTVYDGEDDLLAQAVDEDEPENSLEVVKALLEAGVALDARENRYDRRTALHKAIE